MKTFLWRLKLRIYQLVAPIYFKTAYGIYLKYTPNDNTFRFAASGAYGSFISDHIKSISADIFIDVGANQGLYSILAANNKNIKNIISFEPNPILFERLTNNVQRNNFSEKIVPICAGIAPEKKVAKLGYSAKHSGISSLDRSDLDYQFFCEFLNSEDLVTKLKGFLSENTKIALKVDVEGFEEQVLRQLNNPKLSDNIEWLIVELDNNRQTLGPLNR